MGLSEQLSDKEADIPEVFEPCYGLYPGIASFTSEYDAADYHEWVSRSNGDPVPAPMILIVQDSPHAEGTATREGAAQLPWSTVIAQEIQLQGALFDRDRQLEGVVYAPGIAAVGNDDALYELSSSIQDAFSMAPAAFARWCACFGQIRPSSARLNLLRVLGFSRIRLGMDLSLSCNSADELSAEFEQAGRLFVEARDLGYRSFAIDLILPPVLTSALADRIELFLVQTRVECVRLIVAGDQTGDSPESAISDFRSRVLPGLGYRHLGLDWHVTDAEPSLGTGEPLYWSPLGYTSIRGLDIIGAGPGAVSVFEDTSSQNVVQQERYQRLVERGELPTQGGIELEADDLLRRSVMSGLLINERFDIGALEDRWGIMFSRYFEAEIAVLRELEKQGKLVITGCEIRTTERDRESLLTLCRIFDNQGRVARVPPLREAR